jgi:hypothetical protein
VRIVVRAVRLKSDATTTTRLELKGARAPPVELNAAALSTSPGTPKLEVCVVTLTLWRVDVSPQPSESSARLEGVGQRVVNVAIVVHGGASVALRLWSE